MVDRDEIKSLARRLAECRKDLEGIKGDIVSADYNKVKADISSAISFLNKADKDLTNLIPLEGQMSLFDYDFDDENLGLDI